MSASKRQAIRDFKERKVSAGIYVLRCEAAGAAWIGVSRNIDAQENSVRFALRMGSHPNRDLQAALRAHGADALAYEVLERIEDSDLSPMGLTDELKRREAHWLAALGAGKLA